MKIEIFRDKDWNLNQERIKSNREYWIPKIERNRKRDVEVNTYLISREWKVMRFWSKEIQKELDTCLLKIQSEIELSKIKSEAK
ncbi:DUF559 domain-containing protein [Flavobacterium oncorhynchi]|uniref:DUF559 domain-containing protein n=1 Tax=Flavobacterium oncorhynchi TaxID=728056 RepID=UPI00351AAED1